MRVRGFTLIEALLAVVIIGIAMLALLQIRNQTILRFNESGDQYTAAWLAEMKMAELMSEDLPDPEDEETWIMDGSGDFGDYDERLNELNRGVNPEWTDRRTFSLFEYEWTKELIFVGSTMTGTDEDFLEWEAPLDENGEVDETDDPNEKPAARVVRITLTIRLPMRRQTDEEGEAETDDQLDRRRTVKLVTYVDPGLLYTPDEEDTTETDATNPQPNPNPNPSGENR